MNTQVSYGSSLGQEQRTDTHQGITNLERDPQHVITPLDPQFLGTRQPSPGRSMPPNTPRSADETSPPFPYPSSPISATSSIISSLSDQDRYLAHLPHDVAPDQPVRQASPISGSNFVYHARRGSTSSPRLLQLGSVHSLNIERARTPTTPYIPSSLRGGRGPEDSVVRMSSEGGGSGSGGLGRGARGTSRDSLNPPSGGKWTGSRISLNLSDVATLPSSSSDTRDSALLAFPSPPARLQYRSLPPAADVPSTDITSQPSPPLTPSICASRVATSDGTIHPPSPHPHSPLSALSSPTSPDDHKPTISDHTFGHGSPVHNSPRVRLTSGLARLSAYDPLGGGLSDIASYGSASFSPKISPRSFGSAIQTLPKDISMASKTSRAVVPGTLPLQIRSRTKSIKSAKSTKSTKSTRSRPGSSKRGSAASLAFGFANLSWSLRPSTPDDGAGDALISQDREDGELGRGRERRKKSLRTIKREEQDLDLGRLLGRAAVLEKILNAGKRVSNQSLRHHPMRATDSPLPVPSVPQHHLLPHPRRRPFSLQSTRTVDTSHSSSTPPLPPLPSRRPTRVSLSGSFNSAFGQVRSQMGRRIKREGEWGGEGYTSLPCSEAGSVSHGIEVEVEGEEYVDDEEEMVIPLPKDPPPVPPKPAYLGWKANKIRSGEKGMDTPSCHTRQIILPPSCIPVGFDGPSELHSSTNQNQRRNPILSSSLNTRPLFDHGEDENKEVDQYRQGNAQLPGRSVNRRSKVLSYVSTGQVSWKSRKRWMIWIGVGCIVGLTLTAGVLIGVLAGRD